MSSSGELVHRECPVIRVRGRVVDNNHPPHHPPSPPHRTTSASLPTTQHAPQTAHSPPLPISSTTQPSYTPPMPAPATPLRTHPPHTTPSTSRHAIPSASLSHWSCLPCAFSASAMAPATTTKLAAIHPPFEHGGDRHPTSAIDTSSPDPPTLTKPHQRYHHPTTTLPPHQLPNLHDNLPQPPTPTDPLPAPVPTPPRSTSHHLSSLATLSTSTLHLTSASKHDKAPRR